MGETGVIGVQQFARKPSFVCNAGPRSGLSAQTLVSGPNPNVYTPAEFPCYVEQDCGVNLFPPPSGHSDACNYM